MAKFSPTEAVFAGFRFAKGRPATILVWSAYLLVVLAVASIAMFDIAGDSITALMIASQGSNPDPQQIVKLMEQAAPASMFAELLIIIFGAVLCTAMLRVRLSPAPHPWAGLRFGGDELRMLGATVLVILVVFGASMLVGLVADLAAAAGVPTAAVLIPGLLLVFALQVRLSLTGVISQAEGRISLARSVRLTGRGFWALFGAYVLLAAIALVILFLLAVVFATLIGAVAVASGGGVNQMALALQGRFAEVNPVLMAISIASNLVHVWLAVVILAAFLNVGVDAYRAFADERP